MMTTGTNEFAYLDVTADGRFGALTTSSRTVEDLYVINFTSGAIRQLTKDFSRDRYPRWSRDGKQIYFASDRRGYQMWAINADGSALRELTSGTMYQPIWTLLSPDGRQLAATDIDRRQVLIYNTDDFSKPASVLSPPVEPRALPPRVTDWSPDGRFIAITPQGAGGVWIYSLEDGTARRVAQGTPASWFSDGRRLIYVNAGRVFVLDTTSLSTELLHPAGLNPGAGLRLAAGDSQLFFLQGTNTADIWLVRFAQPDKPQ